MRFQIFSRDVLIGGSNLENSDPSMGFASGPFVPAENYPSVQAVFRLVAEAITNTGDLDQNMLDRYNRESDSLHLSVRLNDGELVPLSGIQIEDYSVELGEMQVTILAPDWQTFARYFESSAGAA